MRKKIFSACLVASCLLGVRTSAWAQSFHGFETAEDLAACSSTSRADLRLSDLRAKQGQKSLEWQFAAGEQLSVEIPKSLQVNVNEMRSSRKSIRLWLYNETADMQSIRIAFENEEGETLSYFDFLRASKGWRAAWIDFTHVFHVGNASNPIIHRLS